MKTCKGCKYAGWDKTKTGKLHPSGQGRCTYPYKIPALPLAFYWLSVNLPSPCGGFINRKCMNQDHCPYWTAE